jgi:hypothetical protein
LKRQKRPAFKFNMIAPLVRLVLGYQRANKTDITFLPGQDARASEHLAPARRQLSGCLTVPASVIVRADEVID